MAAARSVKSAQVERAAAHREVGVLLLERREHRLLVLLELGRHAVDLREHPLAVVGTQLEVRAAPRSGEGARDQPR